MALACHNYVVAVRTTIDIPNDLHTLLRSRAETAGTSIRALIVEAIEEQYRRRGGGSKVTGPLVIVKGELGPAFPVDENPHDLAFS
jgi:hypothetical protein